MKQEKFDPDPFLEEAELMYEVMTEFFSDDFYTDEETEENSDNGSNTVDNQFEKFVGGNSRKWERIREKGANVSPEAIRMLSEAHKMQVWPDGLQKAPSWTGNDDVTNEVREWTESVLDMEDPVWDEFSDVPMAAGLTVKQEIKESLTQQQGWSLDSIDRRLRKEFPHMSKRARQRIARQETAGVLNRAKIVSLLARPDDVLVRWVGPDNSDTTDLCTSLKAETEDGVPMSVMLDLLEQYADEYGGTPERADQGLPHFECRHTVILVE